MRTLAAVVVLVLAGAAPAGAQVVDELSRRQALAHFRAGQELLTAERYEQAAAEFTRAVELNPLLTLAHYGRGQAFMALRRYASAVQAFTDCRDAYRRIADLRQRDIAEALRLETDELNELRDSVRRMSAQLNVSVSTRSAIERRLEELETRRGTRPEAPLQVPAEVSLALGSAYYRNGQVDDAERAWLAAVAVDDGLAEAHNNLAVLYLQTGRKQAAEHAVQAAERAGFQVPAPLKADIARLP